MGNDHNIENKNEKIEVISKINNKVNETKDGIQSIVPDSNQKKLPKLDKKDEKVDLFKLISLDLITFQGVEI